MVYIASGCCSKCKKESCALWNGVCRECHRQEKILQEQMKVSGQRISEEFMAEFLGVELDIDEHAVALEDSEAVMNSFGDVFIR